MWDLRNGFCPPAKGRGAIIFPPRLGSHEERGPSVDPRDPSPANLCASSETEPLNSSSSTPLFLSLSLLWLAAPLGAAQSAEAGNARAGADRRCAGFGPGFVAGADPGQCVKIEERLRVKRDALRSLSPWEAPNAFAPLPSGDGAMPAHLRLNGGFGVAHGPVPR